LKLKGYLYVPLRLEQSKRNSFVGWWHGGQRIHYE